MVIFFCILHYINNNESHLQDKTNEYWSSYLENYSHSMRLVRMHKLFEEQEDKYASYFR